MKILNLSSESGSITPKDVAEYNENFRSLQEIGDRYRNDDVFRAFINKASTAEVLTALGVDNSLFRPDVEVKVLVDTDEIRHLVLPPDPNSELVEEELRAIAGGGYPAIPGNMCCITCAC